MADQAADIAGTTVEDVKADAQALGLKWGLTPATIISADGDIIKGTMDGDASITITLLSLIGYVSPGTRVMTMTVPPSGTYIIAEIGFANDSAWTDFPMVTFSSGVAPSVGAGSQGGRWVKIGHKTILFEGYVLFGAGMSQGTGRYFFPAPFPRSADGFSATGSGYIFDAGVANRGAFAVNFGGLTTEVFLTNTPSGDVGAGVPQAFANGDQILFSIAYEVSSF